MIKLLLLFALFFSSAFANKIIYLSYEEIPSRVIQGEIFPISIKALSILKEAQDIRYSFSNARGLELLNSTPLREKRGKYFYDTFHFLATKSDAKLPDIEASLDSTVEYNTTTLMGKELNIISLNPRKNFSNIIADTLEIVQYKTTSYDTEHNIIVFVASAYNSNIKAMHFENVYKQGSESITESYKESKITYFVIVDKRLENFSFSYFNLKKNNFSLLNIPIIVVDDSVTTQSDLKPKDQSKERLKVTAAAIIAILIFVFILIRKKYIYLFLMLFPLGYMAYVIVPDRIICIKEGTDIQLLPVQNGTIFETTSEVLHLHKEGSALNYTKVKLENEMTGWVKNENICSY